VDDLKGDTKPKKRREMIAEKIVERQKVKEEKKRQKIREERKKWELHWETEFSIRWLKNWTWPGADGSSTMGNGSMEHEGEHFSEHGSNRCSQELEPREVERRHASGDRQTGGLPLSDNNDSDSVVPVNISTERARSTHSLQRYWSCQESN